MVLYLGINYLDKAVAERRSLLSQCLISVPEHLDQVENYPHRGKLHDDKYRRPWSRAKSDEEFLIEESSKIFEESKKLCLADENILQLETLGYSDVREDHGLDEAIIFDLDCDVVPSSNPSSQEGDTTDVTQKNNIFHETFETVDLKLYFKNIDEHRIEEIQPCTGSELTLAEQNVPDLLTLVSRLKPVLVNDPLVDDSDNIRTEVGMFRDVEPFPDLRTAEVKGAYKVLNADENIFVEPVRKQPIPNVINKDEIEEVITTDSECIARINIVKEEAMLLESVTKHRTMDTVEENFEIQTVIEKDMLTIPDPCGQGLEEICDKPERQKLATFLDVNEIIITEEDRFCERSLLDSPLQSPAPDTHHNLPPLQLPHREVLPLSQTTPGLLDNKEKHTTLKLCFSSEQFCDEIQSARLPEPEIAEFEDLQHKDALTENVKQLCKIHPEKLGADELQLCWDIVDYSSMMVLDPCRVFASLPVDKTEDKMEVMAVEPVDKYTPADLYDWRDPLIHVCDKKVNKQVPDQLAVEQYKTKAIEVKKILTESKSAMSFGRNPLDDFMALRSKPLSMSKKNEEISVADEKTSQPQAVGLLSVQSQNTSPQLVNQPATKTRKKIKHHVVTVKLTYEFQQILDVLTETSSTYLHMLKMTEDISHSSTFKSITPDISRFLLKQREKTCADQHIDVSTDEVYRNIVCLHGLSVAADILIHCCLESTIGYLSALHEKYKHVLKDSMETVRQKLFQLKAVFYEKQIYHPKMTVLCREIEIWLKKKRAKSRDNEQKILVLVKRDMPSLLACLRNILNEGKLISSEVMETSDSEILIKSLDEHNCLVVAQRLVGETFPWAQFCLVVEYEYQGASLWQQHCERQNIRHIALNTVHNINKETKMTSDWTPGCVDKQLVMMASTTVTQNTQLLQLLETRQNVQLLERDYSILTSDGHLYFSDLDMDETTCIVLENMSGMADDGTVQSMVTKMAALSVKYTACWFILYSNGKTSNYQLPGHVISNLSRLQAAMANFGLKSNNFYTKLIMCSDIGEMSSVIRTIGDKSKASRKRESDDKRSQTDWLTGEITQEERFLLMIPCLNSCSAQLMLKTFGIQKLLSSTLAELTCQLPGMSVTILKTFLKYVNSSHGLQLIDSFSTSDENEPIVNDKDRYTHVVDEEGQLKDMYVPEDFQNTDSHPKAQLVAIPINNEKIQEVYHSQSEQQENYDDTQNKPVLNTNDIPESNKSFEHTSLFSKAHSREGSTNKQTTNLQSSSNKGGWDNLNSFISASKDNSMTRETESNSCDETDVRQEQAHEKVLRKIDKLHRLQEREILKGQNRNQQQEMVADGFNNENIYKQYQDTSHYFNQNSCKDSRNIEKGDNQIRAVISNTAERYEYPVYADQHSDYNRTICTGDVIAKNKDDQNVEEMVHTNFGNQRLEQQNRLPTNGNQGLFQNEIGQPKQTFDYNHGRHFKEIHPVDKQVGYAENHKQVAETHNKRDAEISNEHLLKVNKSFQNKLMKLIASEFPTSEEIDRSECQLNGNKYAEKELKETLQDKYEERNHSFYDNHVVGETDYDTTTEPNYTRDTRSYSENAQTKHHNESDDFRRNHDRKVYHTDDHDVRVERKTFKNDQMIPNVEYGNNMRRKPLFNIDEDSYSHDVGKEQSLCINFDNQNETNTSEKFNFNPRMTSEFNSQPEQGADINVKNKHRVEFHPVPELVDISNSAVDRHEHPVNSNTRKPVLENLNRVENHSRVYINPHIDRISLKPDFKQDTVATNKDMDYSHLLAEDLRETTRKFLAKSEQFSRFPPKTPRETVSIGLAQPLQRKVSTNMVSSDSGLSTADKMRMAQSPWATQDSPPMDLEYDNTQMNRILYPHDANRQMEADVCHRAVFTSQTPMKKRKLTYQMIPGRRGQTKLVFK